MFNKKQSKKTSLSNIKYTFMVTAIAFVLVMGTGYSSMQSSALDYNGLGDLSAFNGFTQSAECGGLGNDCSEDNRVNNNGPDDGNGGGPIGPLDPSACALCLAELTDEQEAALLVALDVETIAEACVAIGGLTVEAFVEALTEAGLSVNAIIDLLACLDIEVDLLELDLLN